MKLHREGVKYLTLALSLALATPNVGWGLTSTTVTFQNGVDGYNGTVDRRLSMTVNADGKDVDTSTTAFWIDGDPEDGSRSDLLIRFDDIVGTGAIPTGATILNASLDLTTTSSEVSAASDTPEEFNIYRLAKPFDSNSTLDGDFGDGDGQFSNYV
ncbi:MAG: hypothetical protein KDA61_15335, partial [Planctomycetales bacterium]|nr:hypothetical protein [Planctomycetales bacterium]